MTIAFIHPHRAFLPEIDAYCDFFSSHNIKTIVVKPGDANKMNTNVQWHFMGTDSGKKQDAIVKIHEYTSASIPPLSNLKNLSKKIFNARPDYRLFLNEYVSNQFAFDDGVPFGFRDMGIADSFLSFDSSNTKKEYDFIYAGSINTERKIDTLIECFSTKNLKDRSLLVLSKEYDMLKDKLKPFTNIHFRGPIPHHEVPLYISKAKFAINFIIDEEPFNQQTSTKLLEYAALKIPVITTDYQWVKNFQMKNGGRFFYLDNDFSNFTWEQVSGFEYSFPDLAQWSWEKQIRKSGVLEFLRSKFSRLFF